MYIAIETKNQTVQNECAAANENQVIRFIT